MHFMIAGRLLRLYDADQNKTGSGSILIQLLLAGLLGAGILLRASWSKILKLFGKDKPTQPKDEFDDGDDE